MATILRMPEVAANATSATLVSWSKKEGDSIAIGESIADIETEKAVIEFNVETAGVIARLLVSQGDEVAVGAPIAVLRGPKDTQEDVDRLLSASAAPKAVIAKADSQVSTVSNRTAEPVPPSTVVLTQPVPVSVPAVMSAGVSVASSRVFASPVARLLASQHAIDLGAVHGSGPNGRVVKHDVQLVIQGAAESPAHARQTLSRPPPTLVPHTNMRRTIARRLTESKSTVPHFYLSLDCRMDRLLALRAEINATQPQKVSINDCVLKATAIALRDVPEMNVAWTDEAVQKFHEVDISVAVSTEKGLMTPIIRDAASQSLLQIAAQAAQMAARARAGQLRSDEFLGGSFSVSNLGMYGIDEFAAIINPPQAGILAVGAIRQEPVVDPDGRIVVGQLMCCTLSVDHRCVDGAVAARWLAALRQLIQNPVTLLL